MERNGSPMVINRSATPMVINRSTVPMVINRSTAPMREDNTDTLIITCIDKRFVKLYSKAIEELNINNPYILSLPGSGLMIRENRAELKKTINMLSATLTKVIVIDHEDCVAYSSVYGSNHSNLHEIVLGSFLAEMLAINKELQDNNLNQHYIDSEAYVLNKDGRLSERALYLEI